MQLFKKMFFVAYLFFVFYSKEKKTVKLTPVMQASPVSTTPAIHASPVSLTPVMHQ
jgi:hypothetical protein